MFSGQRMFSDCGFLMRFVCIFSVILMLEIPGKAVSLSCFNKYKKTSKERQLDMSFDEDIPLNYDSRYKRELKVALANATKEARKQNKFMKKQLRTLGLQKDCMTRFSLRGTPHIKTESRFKETWADVLSDDFRRLATMVKFVEIALADYNQRFGRLYKVLSDCLCYVEILSEYKKVKVSQVTEDVVPGIYKTIIDQSLLNQRNCLIIRDVHGMLVDMREWYK